jgi:hypothetical protein
VRAGRAPTWSVILGASCLGCLDAPPAGRSRDAGDLADASSATADAGRCPAFAAAPYDDPSHWIPIQDTFTSVDPTPAQVHLKVTPDDVVGRYADLHSVASEPIAGTMLTAQPEVASSDMGRVGISWHSTTGGEDYYDLAVSDGILYARRKQASGGETEVCEGTCPPYSSTDHAHLRLRAEGGMVHYETSSNGDAWNEIGRADISALDYAALLFGQADASGDVDMTVSAAAWLSCTE